MYTCLQQLYSSQPRTASHRNARQLGSEPADASAQMLGHDSATKRGEASRHGRTSETRAGRKRPDAKGHVPFPIRVQRPEAANAQGQEAGSGLPQDDEGGSLRGGKIPLGMM